MMFHVAFWCEVADDCTIIKLISKSCQHAYCIFFSASGASNPSHDQFKLIRSLSVSMDTRLLLDNLAPQRCNFGHSMHNHVIQP